MKKIFFILLLFSSICLYIYLQNGDDMFIEYAEIDDMFIEKIISDYDSHHTFWVSINVEFFGYKRKAVIENQNLYNYFEQFRSIDRKKYEDTLYQMLKEGKKEYKDTLLQMEGEDRKEYEKRMYLILKEKSVLKLKISDLVKYEFKIVPNNKAIIANAQNGVDNFIKTYTVNEGRWAGVAFKKGLTDCEKYAIINQLYNFNIAVRRDDETGSFRVSRSIKNK